ncbi:Putative nicotinic acid mononucleotide adenylyltransferase, NAD(P)-requiring, NadD-like [Herminiimonas arsenicoxydans]|uniref:Probable nicotinate-nucleotide adenylyltransferase n=1 Tax=Herminiimonas arsenicoxydans TaxID=204773 RepID=NADD_HERAR|nr:RecName: Full=Probable nicotinate-nucleotide adenylyltransferase; AltName: Full=Deamido-NAD(+) diphosphorylase; AltName: Full=Deamido-NAD(+) pyrophosphorylase; AltName: Full=Nicotinate mononucleotide adenylyltransferase; Short=NaMN adenylyltransferase [Herminiimonas arsenicoxydans]CAL60761.1 Putative nicotinic acid mononucleotide adenylyltransferase, NAD(P)-requiring, NadD-like [Herminiimonas arsenicoxydans]
MKSVTRCIALLGGSFDPVHNGHVALADYFVALLKPDELRVIPAGNPWQKHGLQASGQDRMAMVRSAFSTQKVTVNIDQQEILRPSATYTIDTLRAIRQELGPHASIVFLMGADQLQHLNTWQEWQHMFDYAHICAASRPGFAMDAAHIPTEVAQEFTRRTGTPEQIRTTPQGLAYLAPNLAVDISATAIRAALQRGERPTSQLPLGVLDYIEQHHLYKS